MATLERRRRRSRRRRRERERGRWRLTRNAAPSWPPPTPPPLPPPSTSFSLWNHPLHPFDGPRGVGEGEERVGKGTTTSSEWPLNNLNALYSPASPFLDGAALMFPPVSTRFPFPTTFHQPFLFTVSFSQSNDTSRPMTALGAKFETSVIKLAATTTTTTTKFNLNKYGNSGSHPTGGNKPPSFISPPRQ